MGLIEQGHTILHVTDFHLADIGPGSREFLRPGYYREYLRDFWQKASAHLTGSVDAIVATGDFVDCGHEENFEHAHTVLMELARLANLDESGIVVCIGNHDLKRKKRADGSYDVDRIPFTTFAKRFANGSSQHESDRAVLIAGKRNVRYLMLDGTLGSTSAGDTPGDLDMDSADRLINDYVRAVPEDELLIIGSHYPIAPFPDDFSTHAEGADYVKRHFWSAAVAFKKRVMQIRQKAATVWLFGDVHHSDAYNERSHIHVLSGRLGTRVPIPDRDKPESYLSRQGRAIVLPSADSSEAKLITCNFTPISHEPQPEMGEWTAEAAAIRRTDRFATGLAIAGTSAISESVEPTQEQASAAVSCPVIVLDQNLNNLIYAKIRDDSLYRMGRFRTSGDRDSLGWVSVGQLLGSGEYLASFCSASLRWLSQRFELKPHRNGAEFAFIGIDCWGAAVAAILGSASGATSICIAVRGEGRFHTTGELVDDDVGKAIQSAQTVVLVTDVIATGRSIASLYSGILGDYPEAVRPEQRWVALSVLIDGNQKSLDTCPFLAGLGVGCEKIKLPGIASALMPDLDIAPAIVSFS